MMWRKPVIILAICFLSVWQAGCITCRKFIKYQGSKLAVSGVKVPTGTGKTIEIASFTIDPQINREASEELQKRDLEQYKTCSVLKAMASGPEKTALQAKYVEALIGIQELGTNALCLKRTESIDQLPIVTSPANARVAEGDDEINSDDWTSVEVSYSVQKSNGDRAVELVLNWYAQERNGNKTKGDTRFASSKTFTLFKVHPSCPSSKIISFEGLAATASREEYFRGKVHGYYPFPDTGSLHGIRVQFDGKGRRDNQRQGLEATLSGFLVHLSGND